jgi:hypothetical protein
MSLTVWAGAPDSFIRLDCDGVGRLKRLPRLFALKIAKGPDRNLTLSFFAWKIKNPATS